MKELHPFHVCSICIQEAFSPQDSVEFRYNNKEINGQLYAVLKLKSLSYIHLAYIPVSQVRSIPISSEPLPEFTFESVLKWKDFYGRKMGLVKFAKRPYSDCSWEFEPVINALKPDLLSLEDWFSSDKIPYIPPPPPKSSLKTTIEKAQELILSFGYDQNDTQMDLKRSYCRLKLGDFGVDFEELSKELPQITALAYQQFNNGPEVTYKGAVLKIRELFFRNIEIMLMKTWLNDMKSGKKSMVSGSETYKTSFSDFKMWSFSQDFALLKAVFNYGFGNWREISQNLSENQDTNAIYREIYGDETVDLAKLELFMEQRTRFLVYCLMEDEYLFCESR